jgi:GNAT superfamily N-acetyltransferase
MNPVHFRLATQEDLPEIVRLLADDELGSQREKCEEPMPESYYVDFEQIHNDLNHQLVVAELDSMVIETFHLMFLPSISYQGGLRAQVESVRVDRKYQNQEIGSAMMLWAIERAKERGAHRFYERLGFKGSHLRLKLNFSVNR